MRYILLLILLSGCAADYPSAKFVCRYKATAEAISYQNETGYKTAVATGPTSRGTGHSQACIVPENATLETLIPLVLWNKNGKYFIVPGRWDYGFTPTGWFDPYDCALIVFDKSLADENKPKGK